jgi:hypothetical protein
METSESISFLRLLKPVETTTELHPSAYVETFRLKERE